MLIEQTKADSRIHWGILKNYERRIVCAYINFLHLRIPCQLMSSLFLTLIDAPNKPLVAFKYVQNFSDVYTQQATENTNNAWTLEKI